MMNFTNYQASRVLLFQVTLSLVFVFGCGDQEKPALTDAEKEAMTVEAATKLCMETVQGNVSRRMEAIDELIAVTDVYPNNAKAHYFLGMCSLAAFVEDGSLAGRGRVVPELERAVELDPTVSNAVGNLALARFNTSLFTKNQMLIDEATQGLIAVADADIFNTFVLSAGLLQLGRDTPYPQMAVERLEQYEAQCTMYDYCRNSEIVPNHDAGLLIHQGDAYVKVGNQAKAEEYYQKALSAGESSSWVFADDAKNWVVGAADRIALHADADPTNDPPYFLSGARTCRGCHQ